MRGDYALFFGLRLQKPLQIAAVTRGSRRFACATADLVDTARPGPVLDLGAGTPNGCFLQMTNAFSSPVATRPLGIAGRRVAHVRRNLPPSQIWASSLYPDAVRETA